MRLPRGHACADDTESDVAAWILASEVPGWVAHERILLRFEQFIRETRARKRQWVAMFLPRPVYTVGQVTQLLNAHEQRKPADRHGQRPIWNRERTRALLRNAGIAPRAVAHEDLRRVAPDAVRELVSTA